MSGKRENKKTLNPQRLPFYFIFVLQSNIAWNYRAELFFFAEGFLLHLLAFQIKNN